MTTYPGAEVAGVGVVANVVAPVLAVAATPDAGKLPKLKALPVFAPEIPNPNHNPCTLMVTILDNNSNLIDNIAIESVHVK